MPSGVSFSTHDTSASLRPPHQVDEALGLLHVDAVGGQVVGGDPRGHEPPVGVEDGPLQGGAGQAQVGQAVLLEQLPVDAGDGQVERGQLPGQGEDLGRGVVVLEPAGVADQAGVEAHRRLAGEAPPQPVGQPAHEHRGGGGVGVDEVHRAVALVAGVMVDDDERAGGVGRPGQLGQAAHGPAVEGDHHLGDGREVGGLDRQVETREERVVGGDDERLRPRRHRVLAGGGGQVVQGQHRAQGVAVGRVVAGEGQGAGGVDGLRRQVELVTHPVTHCCIPPSVQVPQDVFHSRAGGDGGIGPEA